MPVPPVVVQAQHTALVYSRDSVGLMRDFTVGSQIFPIQRSVESRFEGDASHAVHARSFGEVQTPVTTTIEFSGSNIGLRLEFVLMRFDDPACHAEIYFDDHFVGTVSQPWAPRSEMGLIKFFEETLEVPPAISAGLNHAQLRIEPMGCTWLQNDLRVLSYRQTK